MNSVFRTGLAVALASLLAPGLAAAQPGLSKRGRPRPISVTVTLNEVPASSGPVKVKVSLDTQLGLGRDQVWEVVALSGPDGAAIAPTVVEQAGGHRSPPRGGIGFSSAARRGTGGADCGQERGRGGRAQLFRISHRTVIGDCWRNACETLERQEKGRTAWTR